jgi:GDP-4-dehydro-6-deoxy-D-mannose reductase
MSGWSLVTGASGFCARHLVRRLSDASNSRVVGMDIREPAKSEGMGDFIRCDVANAVAMEDAVRKLRPDRVFHLAGLQSGDARAVARVNLLGAANLLEALRIHVPEARVLLVGSAAEYGLVAEGDLPVTEDLHCRPRGDYALSKHAASLLGLDYARRGLRVAVVRPFNVIGAGIPESLLAGALAARAWQALRDGGDAVVRAGNLESERDFIAVEDAVEAYEGLLDAGRWGEVFNVCSGKPVKVRELAERLLACAPRPMRLDVDPALLRPSEVPRIYGSLAKLSRATGFAPKVPLERVLREIWEGVAPGGPG